MIQRIILQVGFRTFNLNSNYYMLVLPICVSKFWLIVRWMDKAKFRSGVDCFRMSKKIISVFKKNIHRKTLDANHSKPFCGGVQASARRTTSGS